MDSSCPDLMFTYLLITWNSFSTRKTLNWTSGNKWKAWAVPGNGYKNGIARVWWRSRGGKWAWFMDYYPNSNWANWEENAFENDTVPPDRLNYVQNGIKDSIYNKLKKYTYCISRTNPYSNI